MPGPLEYDDDLRQIMNASEQKWPMWFENCGRNVALIRDGLSIDAIPKRPKGPAVVVGGGPSFERYEHASVLAEYRTKIPTIITTDRSLKTLLTHTCTPDFVASIDGDPIVAQYYRLHSDERGALVDCVFDAVTINPLTVKYARENLNGKTYWFTHFLDDPTNERCDKCNRLSLTAAFYYFTGRKTIIQAPGNVGAFAWHLAYFLGCDPIILVGMDLGYLEGTPPEKTLYYNGILKETVVEHLSKVLTEEEFGEITQPVIENHAAHCQTCLNETRTHKIKTLDNPDFKNKYVTDKVFIAYRKMLMPFIEKASTTTINATGGGALYGPAIKSMNLNDALKAYC
jgi:hypothetical protein